jgi:hypothetical protein
MHAVESRVVLVLMTISTQGILIEGELPNRVSRDRLMREAIEARVAIDTSNTLSTVRRCNVGHAVDSQVKSLARSKLHLHARNVMAGQAGVVIEALLGRGGFPAVSGSSIHPER